jgi:hypothetical protein
MINIGGLKGKLYKVDFYRRFYIDLLVELSKYYGFRFIEDNGVVLESDNDEYDFIVPYVEVNICKSIDGVDRYCNTFYYREFKVVNKIIDKEYQEMLSLPGVKLKYIVGKYYLDYFINDWRTVKFIKRKYIKAYAYKCIDSTYYHEQEIFWW